MSATERGMHHACAQTATYLVHNPPLLMRFIRHYQTPCGNSEKNTNYDKQCTKWMLKSATAMVTIRRFAILQQRMPMHAIEPTNLATNKRGELVRLGAVPVAVILRSTELKARAHLTTSPCSTTSSPISAISARESRESTKRSWLHVPKR